MEQYIVIGKINDGKRDLGYKLFNYRTFKTEIKHVNEVRIRIENDMIHVVGFSLSESMGACKVKKSNMGFWYDIPYVDGRGLPENENDKDIKMIIGYNGYKDSKVYVYVDMYDNIGILSISQAMELYNQGKIKGALKKEVFDKKTQEKRIVLSLRYMVQLTDDYMVQLGYEKNIEDEIIWHRK